MEERLNVFEGDYATRRNGITLIRRLRESTAPFEKHVLSLHPNFSLAHVCPPSPADSTLFGSALRFVRNSQTSPSLPCLCSDGDGIRELNHSPALGHHRPHRSGD